MSKGRSPKVRKTRSPEDSLKSEVESPESEENIFAQPTGGPQSELTESKTATALLSTTENKQSRKIEIKSEIEIPTSEINMEVHHHPNVEKKSFKEYILEGLMIFLAVTMGFFAEGYREHLSEHSKEGEYIINIKKDLVADTTNLGVWIPALHARMLSFDTLINYLETPGPVKEGSNMYYLARYATRSTVFEPTDNTIQEMKSSGNFRLIRSREIVNDLMNFERATAQYNHLDDIAQREDLLTYPLIGQLFDATIFNKMVVYKKYVGGAEKDYATGQRNTTIRPPGNPQLRSASPDQVNLLVYYLHQRKSTFMGEIHDLDDQRKLAASIIKRINKEYRLDDE
jgi:hypothetical protein